MIDKDNEGYFLSKEEKEVADDFILNAQVAVFEKIFNSSRTISEESEKLGVDIVDIVNKNFWNLIEIENEEK